jgi:hypothetical protein
METTEYSYGFVEGLCVLIGGIVLLFYVVPGVLFVTFSTMKFIYDFFAQG